MRKNNALSILVLLSALAAIPAQAASGDQQAYELSIKCFEANAVARGDAVQLGKKELAASYQKKAKAAFDAALKFGGSLGYTGSAIQQDFDAAQEQELPKLLQDRSYFQKVGATCRAVELM